MRRPQFWLMMAMIIMMTGWAEPTLAQKKKKKKGEPEKTEKKEDKKKVSELIKKHQKFEGLFDIYQDSTSGESKIFFALDQIGQEFIHWYYVENGAVAVSAFRGQFRNSQIIKIEKHFDKIEIVAMNTSFYFDPESALSKSQDANVNNSILFSGKILGGSEEEGGYLIDADPLFLKEILGIVNSTQFRDNPKAFKLGSISKDKSKIKSIRNYSDNTDVVVEYVFENGNVDRMNSSEIADARNISIVVQHSLIKVPENNYEPRFDDLRVGYFLTNMENMTTAEAIAYRDMIHRWDLQKKDTDAAISEPVKPITWWIENTTPVEFRETIKEAVLEWNKAFEAAGFKNAVTVEVQPDDADWDAGDLNYNVLRWTSSPNPPFGGYGPSFVNPKTGQILGADIMLEYVYMTNRIKYSKLFEQGSAHDFMTCSAGHHFQSNTMLGLATLKAAGASEVEMKGLQREAMKELIMHEVGHTLGLNHNMKASQRFSPAELANKETIAGQCLTGSVMDYTAINLTMDRSKQGQYYSTTVGPYDIWAITYGYTADGSEENLSKILARSTEPQLIFGNDADDMRAPGRGIDPRVMIGDMSSDAIAYMSERFEIVDQTMKGLKEKFSEEGESYEELLQNYYMLMGNQAVASRVISRYVGGVYIDRAMVGQPGATKPYIPVSLQDQKRAMDALNKYTFSPSAFSAPSELYSYLARQRRGFNFYGTTEDPKIQERILGIQEGILDQLMHSNTLQRISDSYSYGNKYALSTYMKDLNEMMFAADRYSSVNVSRRNLQVEYTKRLIQILDETSPYISTAKSMALYNLKSIKKMATAGSGDTATQAHRQYLVYLIDQALEK